MSRRRDWAEIFVEVFTTGASYLLTAWCLMLLVGVVHHEWVPIPTLGYWPAVVTVALTHQVVAGIVRLIVDNGKSEELW